MTGILNINKSKGMTSSDVVVQVRKILGFKKIGHFGTLDPMGEGVLPIGIGKATRLFDLMLSKDKIYEAEFKFGYTTDTLDREGKVTADGGFVLTVSQVRNVLGEFIGRQYQIPPSFSAKSVNGVRAYDLARAGKPVELSPSEIEIYNAEVLSDDNCDMIKFRLHCSSGTYVRSFGRDVAKRLGTYATMFSIRRLKCGPFSIEDSITLDELSAKKSHAILSIETALAEIPKVVLDDSCYNYLINGIKLEKRDIQYEKFSLYCNGELFGIAEIDSDDRINITSYLRENDA